VAAVVRVGPRPDLVGKRPALGEVALGTVRAICSSASRVKKPWWLVTITLGNVSSLESSSSSISRLE